MQRTNKTYIGISDPVAAGWIRRPGPEFWLWRIFWIAWRWIWRKPIDASAVRNSVYITWQRPGADNAVSLFHVKRHSEYGFDWGVSTGGCLDLARSILADFLGEQDILVGNDGGEPVVVGVSDLLYNEFHLSVVSAFDRDRWEYSGSLLLTWLDRHGVYFAPDKTIRIRPESAIGQLAEKRSWIRNYFPATKSQIQQLIQIVENSNLSGPGAIAVLGVPGEIAATWPRGPIPIDAVGVFDRKIAAAKSMSEYLTAGRADKLIAKFGPMASNWNESIQASGGKE